MDNSNIDSNYIGVINIYSQMFPSIDADVIKMVIDENKEDEILDILLKLSDDSLEVQSPIMSPSKEHNIVFCENMYEDKKKEEQHKITTFDLKNTEDNQQEYEQDDREYTESDTFFGNKKNKKEEKQGIFGGLFKRNVKKPANDTESYLDEYDPYDRL